MDDPQSSVPPERATSGSGLPPEPTDRPGARDGPVSQDALAIDARDLFKIYKHGPAETVALRGASLAVRPAEFVSLEGPSGSGKTTLLSILAGLTAPSAGRAVVDGHDLGEMDEAALSRWRATRVGMVFQRANLVPFLSAQENVALIARQHLRGRDSRRRAGELLEVVGLSGRARHRPGRLSGGERQRVAIAIALANDPVLLLGDEITGELDTETSAEVMSALMDLQRQRMLTMVLVTHNPTIARLADRRLEVTVGVVRAA